MTAEEQKVISHKRPATSFPTSQDKEPLMKTTGLAIALASLTFFTGCAQFQQNQAAQVAAEKELDNFEKNNMYYPIQPVNFVDFYENFDYFRDYKKEGKQETTLQFRDAEGKKKTCVVKKLSEIKKRIFSLGNTEDKAEADCLGQYIGSVGKEKTMELFPNESSRVFVEQYSQRGQASVAMSNISMANTSYHITIDYLKYRTDNIADTIYVSGFGLRMRARVTTEESGIDLSNIFALGAAASQNKVKGSLEFDSIGISGPQITPLVPVPQNLSTESISAAIQALAAIKSKIYADYKNVKIWPQVAGTVGGDACKNTQRLLTGKPELCDTEKAEDDATKAASKVASDA